VDLVLFAVKLWDTERAAEQLRHLVASHTRVVTLQNGVDSVERLTPILGDAAVIGGSTYVVTVIAAPGVIRHTSPFARIRCGRLDGQPDSVLAGYVEQVRAAGWPGVDTTGAERAAIDRIDIHGSANGSGSSRPPDRSSGRPSPRSGWPDLMRRLPERERLMAVKPPEYRCRRYSAGERALRDRAGATRRRTGYPDLR
jgi:2-dehydropantoate 2-reductase